MKYLTYGIIIVLLFVISTSVKISDKYVVIGHGFSQEEVSEFRYNVFSGIRKTHTGH
tara:strand:+ start:596 stop:766 length:171 start_codon:yes stop_codon:yes gene_type:complete